MKPAFSDQGIVIKSLDFAEADKIVGIVTENHGFCEFIARGARRLNSKKAPHLDLFNLVKFQSGRGNSPQLLIQADTVCFYPSLKKSFVRTKIAMLFAEILTRVLAEDVEDRQLYLSLVNFMNALETAENPDNFEILEKNFGGYLLRHLGFPKVPDSSNLISYFESIVSRRILSADLK